MKAPRDQHFLVDQRAIDRIIECAGVDGKSVLEIGPGEGVLTRALLDAGATVSAIEVDRTLIAHLTDRFVDEIRSGFLTLIEGDAARCPFPPFEVMVANLPYSISSPITFRLLDTDFSSAVLMYQREFAARMAAPVGTSGCGRLSVMVQTYALVEECFTLSPFSFNPPPAVDSMVVRIRPYGPIFPITDRSVYAAVVRILFSQRRKTVRNGLKGGIGIYGKPAIAGVIEALPEEILGARPQTLYLEDYATIANLVSERSGLST
ncbi:16S rRNA (adenine(1518)-N(6)/adenine(1519)-N(6))-dimethyltransferase RsmA [Methanosphaerula palustris]|uniref:Probable ribosomal RNA small subunit methyltransferase A n=1 Tax=Methanosphaerula palustris (strain ATCC BAA-1556 / DSM 19958 / E1-9c) TaxID=521011 RepID=B8GEV6_METPE|nr:16S rRNA (adenine(1518)-N(6)/adenine(1519)-N(6))-dimethyltransferase RsmA [Methanosphaerula palustris]ACL15923.1 dimethyladenosine transferase [Methanosphaerula palustris E1-9c]